MLFVQFVAIVSLDSIQRLVVCFVLEERITEE